MSEEPQFRDDESIGNDELIYRIISKKFVKWETVALSETPKIPSQGFQDQPDHVARGEYGLPGACMSVDLDSIFSLHNQDFRWLLQGFDPEDGIVSIEVGSIRSLKGLNGEDWAQGLCRSPKPNRPCHAVTFVMSGRKKTKGMQTALSQLARWVIVPPRPV